ncbi:MAG: hypothetical protein NT169_22560 [Chloroflexi bacterium]|nr:hypothetical protein [Chloroflexota bacterium]
MQKREAYQAYLVRLWPTQRGGVADYRVTVQSAATGERRCFPDLGSLLAFWQTLRVSPALPGAGGDLEAKEK